MSVILIPVVLGVYTLAYVSGHFIRICIKNTNNHNEETSMIVANPIRYRTVATQVSATPVELENEEIVNIITIDPDGNIIEQLSTV